MLMCPPALSEDQPARPGEPGIELVTPLKIGHRSVQGWVGPSDVAGMLDEPADDLQPLRLAPPGSVPQPLSDGFKKWTDTWVKVGTCREWMRLHAAGWYAFDTADQGSDSEFLTACGTLYSIGLSRAAKTSYLPRQGLGDLGLYSPLLLGEIAVDKPDEHSWQDFATGGRSLRDLARDVTPPIIIAPAVYPLERYYDERELASDRQIAVVNYDKETIEYFYNGVRNSLSLLARGDFTGSGLEEFLVFYGYDGGGSLGIGKLLVLGRTSDTAPIAPVGCVLAYQPCELDASLKSLPASSKP